MLQKIFDVIKRSLPEQIKLYRQSRKTGHDYMRYLHVIIYSVAFVYLCAAFSYAGDTAAKGLAIKDKSMIKPVKSGNKYENWIDTPLMIEGVSWSSEIWKWIKGADNDGPKRAIPIERLDKSAFLQSPAKGLTARWLGHSSVLVEIGGVRVLIDPVFEKYAAPVPGFNKRFSASPVQIEDLPRIDAVVISHDHSDHLEEDTVKYLAQRGAVFFVPLDVGRNYLLKWGVAKEQIREMTWWEEARFQGLTFVCTPARHYSGRGLFDRNETLWAGWLITSGTKSVFYSGDTGYAGHFSAIGEKYGPIDLTLIKVGAYGATWPHIHLTPEEAVRAHVEIKGRLMLPTHWATFKLALHAWDEPILRTIKDANENKASIVTPMIGEIVDVDTPFINRNWWEEAR